MRVTWPSFGQWVVGDRVKTPDGLGKIALVSTNSSWRDLRIVVLLDPPNQLFGRYLGKQLTKESK